MTQAELAAKIKVGLLKAPLPEGEEGDITLGQAIGIPFGMLDAVCRVAAKVAQDEQFGADLPRYDRGNGDH